MWPHDFTTMTFASSHIRCSDCLSRSFQQVLGKEPTFTFPVALKAFSLQLQLFWCVWGTGKLRFLTMHYSAGQVQALPWICTKGRTQLGEPEPGTTSPEPRVPLLLTATCCCTCTSQEDQVDLWGSNTVIPQPALPNHPTSHSTSLLTDLIVLAWVTPSSRLSRMAWPLQWIL